MRWCQAFVGDEDVEVFDKVEDVSKWSRAQRARSEAIYGAEELQTGWSGAWLSADGTADDAED